MPERSPLKSEAHCKALDEQRRSTPETIDRTTKILWRLLTSLALFIGIGSLRYALPHIPFPAPLPNFLVNRDALIVHAISASLALLLGPWQFIGSLRRRRPLVHRWMGRTYAISLLVATLTAIWIAPHAAAGHISSAGFLGLAFGWIFTTSMGVSAVRKRRVALHRKWMIRSYALTASAITLRLYLALIPLLHLRFAIAYPAISWLCWIPNLVLAEVWIRWTASPVR
jgi:uncharacterized membrane protein